MRIMLVTAVLLSAALLAGRKAAEAQTQSRNVSILYTGDTQGHLTSFYYDSKKPVGGIAKRAIYFAEKRRHSDMIWLTLDSGDAISGTPLSNAFEGWLDIEAMNRLKYDAMCLGVHEFDYGVERLRAVLGKAQFPVLSANIVNASTGETFVKPYVILERDGLRIAIFGLTTAEIDDQLPPEKFSGLQVLDPIATAEKLVPQLAAQSDIIIALTHLGIDEDIRLSSKLQDIDVIVGGMSHSELQVPMKVGRTLIVHDGEYGRNVGLLKLAFQQTGADWENKYFDSLLEPMAGKWVENSDMVDWLAEFQSQLGERMSRVAGTSSQRFSNLKIYSSETELGNYVCDVLRQRSGADVALLPAAFFRGDIEQGDVTLADLYTALPYDHYGMVLTVSGAELIQILSEGASSIGRPGFPQVSGVSFGMANSKAYDVRVNGVDVQPFDTYRLATSDYLASGNLGYATLGTIRSRRNTGYLIRDMVLDTLRTGQQASAALSGRINFVVRDEQPQYVAEAGNQGNGGQSSGGDSVYQPVQDNSPLDDGTSETPVTDDIPRTDDSYQPAMNTDPPPTSDNGQDLVRYDRYGNPIDDSAVPEDPVTMDDSRLDDIASDVEDTVPDTIDNAGDQAREVVETTIDDVLPDNRPLSSGSLPEVMGSETVERNGLVYNFTVVPGRDPGTYRFKLDVLNTTSQRVQLDYETSEIHNFQVRDGDSLIWDYNANRFFVQNPQRQTINPSEALNFEALWEPRRTDSGFVPRPLRVIAVHNVSGEPVVIEFMLNAG
ncbi:5'-nucleotidase C-terminal domain-containing protein [bacterium]|nr:5'-nucleotidase C-terminal domain-containing protein [bacterium]